MLISKNKDGFIIMEVLVSLCMFSLIVIIAVSMQLNCLKLKKYTMQKNQYMVVLEGIKNTLMGNATYTEILGLKNANKLYIHKENLTVEAIKKGNNIDKFSDEIAEEYPFLSVTIEGEETAIVKLEMHIKISNKEEVLKCEFYKGNYQ